MRRHWTVYRLLGRLINVKRGPFYARNDVFLVHRQFNALLSNRLKRLLLWLLIHHLIVSLHVVLARSRDYLLNAGKKSIDNHPELFHTLPVRSLEFGTVFRKEWKCIVHFLLLSFSDALTHEYKATIANSCKTSTCLQELLEQSLAVPYQVIGHTLCLVESRCTISAGACWRFETY